MANAVLFYDRLLLLLDYDLGNRSISFVNGHDKQVVPNEQPRLGFVNT
jgi:hypothetical protein